MHETNKCSNIRLLTYLQIGVTPSYTRRTFSRTWVIHENINLEAQLCWSHEKEALGRGCMCNGSLGVERWDDSSGWTSVSPVISMPCERDSCLDIRSSSSNRVVEGGVRGDVAAQVLIANVRDCNVWRLPNRKISRRVLRCSCSVAVVLSFFLQYLFLVSFLCHILAGHQ